MEGFLSLGLLFFMFCIRMCVYVFGLHRGAVVVRMGGRIEAEAPVIDSDSYYCLVYGSFL